MTPSVGIIIYQSPPKRYIGQFGARWGGDEK
jgi:hypothetical protein